MQTMLPPIASEAKARRHVADVMTRAFKPEAVILRTRLTALAPPVAALEPQGLVAEAAEQHIVGCSVFGGHIRFVRDNWVGVSVAGLLARPSTPPIVIERVAAGQLAPTIEAVQSAIDAVEAQVSAPPPDPAERARADNAEFHAINAEIREAQAMILRGVATTAPALALLRQRLTPEEFDMVLREEEFDRATAELLIGCAVNPPRSLDDIPESLVQMILPWAIRKHTAL